MSSLPLGLQPGVGTGTTVDNSWLFDNKTVTVEAGNVTATVGQRDLVDFIGVQPDLAFSAFEHGGG